jgi:hypothetical protein
MPSTLVVVSYSALTLARIWTLKALDDGALCVKWLALDFKKAFDSVSHNKILDTLQNHFKVNDSVLLWLYDYLWLRQQGVIIDGHTVSSLLPCTSGVPQGSILGPILFATVLDPCQIASPNTKLICYADDCTVMHRVFAGNLDTLQSDSDELITTAAKQGLDINPQKCQLLVLTGKRSLQTNIVSIKVANHSITAESSITILGIWLSSDLKWKTHLEYKVYKKCAKAAYLIKMLKNCGLKGSSLWHICEALVFSHLAYCWPVLCH